VNLHGSLLPRWRGAAPIQRALEAGDHSTGVSLQKMVQKLDAGDVLLEQRMLIGALENAEELSQKLSLLSAQVLTEYFTKVFQKSLDGMAQDESLVTYAAKITKEEALWSPTWGALETHNRVRGFYLWPQVKATLSSGEIVALTKTGLNATYNGKALAPGEIVLSDGRVYLGTARVDATSEPVLEVIEIKPANRGSLSAWDYFQNHAARDTLTLK
jgi:methionyl-tRNA formyltransferase